MATLSLLSSQILLGLYPVLVRSSKENMLTQTMVRLMVTALASFPFISMPLTSVITGASYYLVSLLYVFHIYASYIGFQRLEVGFALTLFHTYPLINVLLKSGPINLMVIFYFLLSIAGVYMIGHSHGPVPVREQMTPRGLSSFAIGMVALLFASLSESLIYTFYKTWGSAISGNPFNMLFTMCFAGSIVLLAKWFKATPAPSHVPQEPPEPEKRQFHVSPKLVILNLLLGFIGYLLYFYSLPLLTTEWFSILTFIGVIFGYLYGWFFFNEAITVPKMIGTVLIMLSVYQIKNLGYT